MECWPTSNHHMLGHQLRQPDLLGQRSRRHQPGISDQIRLIEHNIHRRNGMW
jgi:hypothetical protein